MGARSWRREGVVGIAVAAAVAASLGAVAAQGASSSRRPARPVPAQASIPPDRPQATQGARPTARVSRSRADLRRALGARGFVAEDARTGTVRVVGRLDGYLTGPSGAAPADVALGWVRRHRAALGLSAADVAALRLVRSVGAPDGVRTLTWEQRVDGIPVADAVLRASVTRTGRLVTVAGGARALSVPRPAVATPAVDPRDAYGKVLRSAGVRRAAPPVRRRSSGRLRATTFAGSGTASLFAYRAGAATRLAWRVVAPAGEGQTWQALVDARTGAVVRRENLVKFGSALVHPGIPGEAGGAQELRSFDTWLPAGAQTLSANRVHAFLDVDDSVGLAFDGRSYVDRFAVPAAGEVPPSNGSDWLYPQTLVPSASCPATGCTWDPATPYSWQANARQATTQLFFLASTYLDHLAAPPIGFDESSGNFQAVNGSGLGAGGDAVLAQADDGANLQAGLPDLSHVDNANMDTRPDGTPGRLQTYLWRPLSGTVTQYPFVAVNGADDPTIVDHELTHGMTNRLVTDAQGFGALSYPQAGAMGEGWSDWYAMDALAGDGLVTDAPGVADVRVGAYVSGGGDLARTEPIDCRPGDIAPACPGTAQAGAGGYTLGDFGRVTTGPEVHADGEIWAQTLWQLRAALIAAHGAADGARRAEQIVTGGLRMSPPQPTFLDERNAILLSDMVNGNGDAALIWRVFAARGMGYSATTTGDQDLAPVEDFSLPPGVGAAAAAVSGTVTATDGTPVAGVGVTLGAAGAAFGTAPATVTAADGSYRLEAPQGTYPGLTVTPPPGYVADADATPLVLGADPVDRDVTLRLDLADSRAGAALVDAGAPDVAASAVSTWSEGTPAGCDGARAIDGDPSTAASAPLPAGSAGAAPPAITVRLARPVDDPKVVVDPTARCDGSGAASLGAYTVSMSADGTAWTDVASGTFTAADRGHGVPVAVSGAPAGTRYLRLTATSAQAPDPGEPAPTRVGVAEIEVSP